MKKRSDMGKARTKLRRLVEFLATLGIPQRAIAVALGIKEQTVSAKLHHDRDLRHSDLRKIVGHFRYLADAITSFIVYQLDYDEESSREVFEKIKCKEQKQRSKK
jgi:transcriptional regulator with XRE-family HTH domain